jgi:hypothetical protein
MHRAKIAQPRVRMEGWRQRRPGSNARNPQEGKRKQKEKNTLDSYRPSHGRHLGPFVGAWLPVVSGIAPFSTECVRHGQINIIVV